MTKIVISKLTLLQSANTFSDYNNSPPNLSGRLGSLISRYSYSRSSLLPRIGMRNVGMFPSWGWRLISGGGRGWCNRLLIRIFSSAFLAINHCVKLPNDFVLFLEG
ncbi:hypothetical protein CDAR_565711 [Caerostris darwini]|uniref:Uncharacterized protein n=1 Tax=Caerostris darwini TaxID=1538125 RepID=A0AAV4UZN4_9ARAC|nr:hypothetical protein CDAR_565711 [Caerostris darwini]